MIEFVEQLEEVTCPLFILAGIKANSPGFYLNKWLTTDHVDMKLSPPLLGRDRAALEACVPLGSRLASLLR